MCAECDSVRQRADAADTLLLTVQGLAGGIAGKSLRRAFKAPPGPLPKDIADLLNKLG